MSLQRTRTQILSKLTRHKKQPAFGQNVLGQKSVSRWQNALSVLVNTIMLTNQQRQIFKIISYLLWCIILFCITIKIWMMTYTCSFLICSHKVVVRYIDQIQTRTNCNGSLIKGSGSTRFKVIHHLLILNITRKQMFWESHIPKMTKGWGWMNCSVIYSTYMTCTTSILNMKFVTKS